MSALCKIIPGMASLKHIVKDTLRGPQPTQLKSIPPISPVLGPSQQMPVAQQQVVMAGAVSAYEATSLRNSFWAKQALELDEPLYSLAI